MSSFAAFPEWLRALAGVSAGAVGLAWLLTLLLRRQSAAWRHLVWRLALCAPLAALPLVWLHPRVSLPILSRASETASTDGRAGEPSAARQSAVPPLADAGGAAPSPHPASASLPQSRFGPLVRPWTGGWFLGALFVGARLLAARWRLERLVRASRSPEPPDLRRHLDEARQAFRFAGEVRLLINPLTGIPFCHGAFRPVIHFPESGQGWDAERIRICLGHELAHIVRGDLGALLVSQWACVLCWFNPLVWFAAARLRSEAERSADDLVLGGNVVPAAYAAHLVAITEHCQGSALPALGIALAMARPHRLRARIDAILDPMLRRCPPGRVTILAVSFLALSTLTASMTFRLTAAPAGSVAANQTQDLATIDPQTRDRLWTMVSEPIERGDTQAVASLLERGLNVNVNLDDNCSPLFVAADDHQLDIVKFLLSKGADVNKKTSWGDTPLRRACWRGYREIADALIHAGATIDGLLYAAGMGDAAAMGARDARQPITAKEARDAINFAVASGHENTFDLLWQKLGPLDDQHKDKLLVELYENAAKWGQVGMLRHLQKLGATPAKYGSRALVNAVLKNHVDTVKYLLEEGVSPSVVPPRWEDMLRESVGEGHTEIARLLLDHGADLDVRDEQGMTPLSWAAYRGKEDTCLLLLEHGADGGIEDEQKHNAAWHAAAGAHCPTALEIMLKKGVKVTG